MLICCFADGILVLGTMNWVFQKKWILFTPLMAKSNATLHFVKQVGTIYHVKFLLLYVIVLCKLVFYHITAMNKVYIPK